MSLLSNPSATWSKKFSTNVAKSSISPMSLVTDSKYALRMSTQRNCLIRSTRQPKHSGSNSFEAYVVEKSNSVNRLLEEAVLLSEPVKLYESMRYSLLASGSSQKRVRAAVCIAGCEIVGGQESTAVTAACAVEMMHTGISILSDLPGMDNNGSRWGKPTNHMIFGEDIASLSAYALVALAFERLVSWHTEPGVPSDRILEAVSEMSKCVASDMNKSEALFEGSLVIGAILGSGEPGDYDKHIAKLRDFATSIGPSFLMVESTVDDVAKPSPGSNKWIGKSMDAKNHLAAASFDPHKVAPLIALADCVANYQL